MTDTTPTAPEPARADLSRQSSPGEYLRKLREEKGHTHAVVGQALHLTVHYIKALEGDEYGKLPGLTFVKGYLRSYARFLGADVDNVIARFDEHIAGLLDAGMHTARVERSKRRQDQALRWAVGAGFVVVASIAAGWWFVSGRHAAAETTQATPPAQQTASVRSTTTAAVSPRSTPQPVTSSTLTPPPSPTLTAGNVVTPAANATSNAVTQPAPAAAGQVVTQLNIPQQNTITAGIVAPPAVTPSIGMASTTTTAQAPLTGQGAPLANASPATATPTAIVTPNAATGARQVSLVGAGDDELRVSFNGNSWIEVDDGSMVRVYQDMLSAGDTLTIRGNAPFHVLLGDASKVAVALNAMAVDISADIRDDSTARLVVGAPAAAEAAPAPVTQEVIQ